MEREYKKGDIVEVKITEELRRKMPVFFGDSETMKGRVYCNMKKTQEPALRVDFSDLVQVQVPLALVVGRG